MELAKIFCVTKNEYDLIEDFILYYGHFFGYDNIIIIDNNSSHPMVLDVYRKYSDLGVTVVNTPSYIGNSQGHAFTKYMLEYASQCKWLIGLDTDEFMTPVDEKENLLDILKNIPSNISFCNIPEVYNSLIDTTHRDYINNKFNRPARSITTFYPIYVPKKFYRSECFISTSIGNHWGVVDKNFNYIPTTVPIRYIHFHQVGQKREIERAKTIVSGYNYIDIHENLFKQWDKLITMNDPNLTGVHRVIEYRNFIIRKILIDLFCRYVKRLPTPKELEIHSSQKVKKLISSEEIIYEFKECQEAKNKITSQEYSVPEEQEHNLLYSDSRVMVEYHGKVVDLPESHRISTYVKNILTNL
jgi:hypothetical protein